MGQPKKKPVKSALKKIEKSYLFSLILIKIGPMIQKLKTLIKGDHFDGHPKKII